MCRVQAALAAICNITTYRATTGSELQAGQQRAAAAINARAADAVVSALLAHKTDLESVFFGISTLLSLYSPLNTATSNSYTDEERAIELSKQAAADGGLLRVAVEAIGQHWTGGARGPGSARRAKLQLHCKDLL